MRLRMKNQVKSTVSLKQGFIDNVRTMGYAIGIALIFRSFLFEPFHIPSASMRGTLLEGDYIFVSKFAYGYSRYSFPFGTKFDYFGGRSSDTMPERGDVIVFRLPTNTSIDYIKRVIGLPGDTVQVVGGRVWLNGELLEYERVEDFVFRENIANPKPVLQYRETLPDGASHQVLDRQSYGTVDDTQEFVVPQGHLFMMGDNRDDSIDSRYQNEVGFVPIENVVGKANIILFSWRKGHDVAFWQFWRYPETLREGRLFKRID